MTYQFETMEKGAESTPPRETFMEAWDDMYKYVKKNIGNISLQVLETSIWIAVKADGSTMSPWNFYDARDFAIDNFKWVEPK